MKTAIRLSALLLLVSSSIFASTPAKTDPIEDQITIQTSTKLMLVGLNIQKETTGKAFVTFYDSKNHEIMRDYLSSKKSSERAYNISELETGDYTMAISSNDQLINKKLHVFEEYGKKTYFFYNNL